MLRVGLTGGIGSGKSLVSEVFRTLGIPVYEADKEAHRLMETNEQIQMELKALFGEKVFLKGELNRKYLASIVFQNQELLNRLNSIVHPAVHKDFQFWSEKHLDKAYVIEEAAILFESGGAEKMDYTIFVKAAMQTRLERVMERDGISEQAVKDRIRNQLSDVEKEGMADFCILNENNSMILPQIVDLHNKFLELNK